MGQPDTRARIQGAAAMVFRRHGYSATGLKRIATADVFEEGIQNRYGWPAG
ncbi:hypothetical protein AB0L33_34295 [Streptomyces sp. NPDC052299]|uniref:hypothetical protein n=1 Tax=Streptomyces sp. NPDC052299 TaxID=3155054 RepID=UPI003446F243